MRILVTGAAGLIGSELCGLLAERGHAVIALLHRTDYLLRNDGRVLFLPRYAGAGLELGALLSVAGDIGKPGLGFDPTIASALANSLDIVVHCAAETRFASASSQHRRVNVDGTRNVLAFAGAGNPRQLGIVHLSTAYVCGCRSGAIAEDEINGAQDFANGYEASKATAETLVRESGLAAAIARPSIVVGTSDTGAIGRFEDIYSLLRLIGSGRIGVLPVATDASLDLVPIDHVLAGLIDIIEHFQNAAGQTFHLVSQDPAPLEALVALDYPGFSVPQLVHPDAFDVSQLDQAEAFLYENVTSLYASYLSRNPRFKARNLRRLTGRGCPPTGHGFLRRIVDYAAKAGYLHPRTGANDAVAVLT